MNPLSFVWALLGAVGMLILEHAPVRSWLIAGGLGGLAYLLYEAFTALGVPSPLPVLTGCLAGCFLAQLAARKTRMIASVYLTAAIVPCVPGLGLYRCMALLGQGDTAGGAAAGAGAMADILMIALAVAVSSFFARLVFRTRRRDG